MFIYTKDYGFKAYLVMKYEGGLYTDGVELPSTVTASELDLIKEYNNSPFVIYNHVLKRVISFSNNKD